MKQFSFELLLLESNYPSEFQADEFLDRVEDKLFEAFEGDVTPAMIGGVPTLYCTLEAKSLGEAFDRVSSTILKMGLHPSQMLMNIENPDKNHLLAL